MNRLILVALLLIWASAPLFAKERAFPPLAELQNSKMCKKALKELPNLKVIPTLRPVYTLEKLQKYRNMWRKVCNGGQVGLEELYRHKGRTMAGLYGDASIQMRQPGANREEIIKNFLELSDYIPAHTIRKEKSRDKLKGGGKNKTNYELGGTAHVDSFFFLKPWLTDNNDDYIQLLRARSNSGRGNRNPKYGPVENSGCQFLGRLNLDIVIPILDKPSSQKKNRKNYRVERYHSTFKRNLSNLFWCHVDVIQVCEIEPEVARKHYQLLFDYMEKYDLKPKRSSEAKQFTKQLFQKSKAGTLKIVKAPTNKDTINCTPVD